MSENVLTRREQLATAKAKTAKEAVEAVEKMPRTAPGFRAAYAKARKAIDAIPSNAGEDAETMSLHERLDEL